MKITFEEYLDSYKNEPVWLPRPTLEEYEKIQEECLLAEFLGYKERPNTIVHRYDEQGEVWYEQNCEYGLYLKYDPMVSNRKVFEGNDEMMIGDMNWFDWNNLMVVVDKVRAFPSNNSMLEGAISIERFEISRTGMLLSAYQYRKNNSRREDFYHQFVEGKPEASDCESYIETIYKTMVDFIKWINEEKVSV